MEHLRQLFIGSGSFILDFSNSSSLFYSEDGIGLIIDGKIEELLSIDYVNDKLVINDSIEVLGLCENDYSKMADIICSDMHPRCATYETISYSVNTSNITNYLKEKMK